MKEDPTGEDGSRRGVFCVASGQRTNRRKGKGRPARVPGKDRLPDWRTGGSKRHGICMGLDRSRPWMTALMFSHDERPALITYNRLIINKL